MEILTKSELTRIYQDNGNGLKGDTNALLETADNFALQLNIAGVLQQIDNFYKNETNQMEFKESIKLIQDLFMKTQWYNEG